MERARETLEDAAEGVEVAINNATAAGTERVNATVNESQKQAELMTQMLMRVNRSLSELPMMGKIELPNERLEKQIASFAETLEALIIRLAEATRQEAQRVRPRQRRWYWLYLK